MRSDLHAVKAALLALLVAVTLGCATQRAPRRCLDRPYTSAELTTIMKMRDGGEGLNEVADVVGGTRQQVKQAESDEKLRRRARRTSPDDTAVVSRR